MSVAFADFVFDPEGRELSRDGVPLKVDAKLLQLLRYFVAHPGRLISKRELLEQVWEGRAVADNVLSVSVAKLRKVLGHKPGVSEFIDNSYGRGYRFVCAVRAVESGAGSNHASVATQGSTISPPVPLVGRSAELTRLCSALDRAEQGRGSLCLVVGEPGIGKTRLCESLERYARGRGIVVAWGRCQASEGTPPLWPFVQVLREVHGADLPVPVIEDTTRVTAETHASLESNGHAMLSQDGLYAAVRSSHSMIDGVMQGLIRASKHKPLLVFIDDLQWADAASVRLLSYLVGELSRWPILVVATARGAELADEKGDRDLIRISSHANCERIALSRLEREQVEQYVSAVFGREAPELSAAVYARSEGNPFFMIELLRPFMGHGDNVPSPDELQVSSATRGLVRDRLAHLPENAREVLSAAAVIGHDFDLGVLSYVADRPPHELLEALEDSLANETVVPSEDQIGAYAFDHALIRDVLYADLPIRRRCEWHIRAGQALLKRRASGGEVSSAELAHHFLSGLPQGEVGVAVGHARDAAAAATRVGAHSDARALLRRALAALRVAVEPEPAQRSAILLELAIVERMLGDPSYHEHLAQGIELARQVRLGALLKLAGQFLSPGPGILTDVDADVVLEAAYEVLPEDDYAGRAIVLAHQAWTPPNSTSARKVKQLLHEARELAQRSQDHAALSTVRDAELFFSAGPATFPRAQAIAAEMERELATQPKRVEDWRAISLPVFRVITSSQRGDAAAVERAIQTLSGLHAKLNNTELLWHHERLLMIQRMMRGEWSSIGAELERLRDRAQRLRLWSWRAIYALDFGSFLYNTLDIAEYAPLVRPEIMPREHDSANSRSIKLRTLAEYGFVADARDALQAITLDALRDLPQDRDYLAVLTDLSVVACAARALEHAQVLYELLEPYPDYFSIGISFHCQGSIAHYLGNLAWVLGRPEAARDLLERGAASNQRFHALTMLIHNELDLARLLIAPGPVQDAARARVLLDSIAERAGAMGMKPAQATALRLREQVTGA